MRLRARIASLAMVAVGIGAVAACGFTAPSQSPRPALSRIAATAARPPAQASPSPGRSSASPAIEVTGAPGGVKARGAVLANTVTGQVLWGRAAGTELPMASVTKVMTALLVLESGHLGQEVQVPQAAFSYAWKYGGESAALHPGDVLTVGELLEALLVPSGADAAYTLANAYGPGLDAFVARMNATAARMGMTHTHFTSPDGLPYPTETSTYSTPSDLLTLGLAAMQSPVFRSIVAQRFYQLRKGPGHHRVLVGQHERPDRLVPGRRRDQDRVHRRRRALPAVRGDQDQPEDADEDMLDSPATGPAARLTGRRAHAELGLRAPPRRLTFQGVLPAASHERMRPNAART